ncbi:hypothetical protein FBY22_4045 [Streptomyces sp. SLBN-31]|nr:hypothetical protein FBY22_4045 [Streptomyces sp. SLBN-31]
MTAHGNRYQRQRYGKRPGSRLFTGPGRAITPPAPHVCRPFGCADGLMRSWERTSRRNGGLGAAGTRSHAGWRCHRRRGDREVPGAIIFMATSGCTRGSNSIAWSWISSAPAASWTGPVARAARSASALSEGAANGTKTGPPRQGRVGIPSDRRPRRVALSRGLSAANRRRPCGGPASRKATRATTIGTCDDGWLTVASGTPAVTRTARMRSALARQHGHLRGYGLFYVPWPTP